MPANFLKIFENESLQRVIGLSVAVIALGFSIWGYFSKQKKERIRCFVDRFGELYDNKGKKLKVLIPAGINTLKNNKEIKMALDRLADIFPGHPLRNWKTRVEKIGYKKFFYQAKSVGELDKYSMEDLLKRLENS